jgi:hypothetical protein
MKPYTPRGFRHALIGARELAIMRDMGWKIPPAISGHEAITTNSCTTTYTLLNLPPNTTNHQWSWGSGIELVENNGLNGIKFKRPLNLSAHSVYIHFDYLYNGTFYRISKQIQVHNRPIGIEIVDANTHNALSTPLIGNNYYFKAIHPSWNTLNEVMNYAWTLQVPNATHVSNMCDGMLWDIAGGQTTQVNPVIFHCAAPHTVMLITSDGCGTYSNSMVVSLGGSFLPCGCVNLCTCPPVLPCGCIGHCSCPPVLPCGCIGHCSCPPPVCTCTQFCCVCPPCGCPPWACMCNKPYICPICCNCFSPAPALAFPNPVSDVLFIDVGQHAKTRISCTHTHSCSCAQQDITYDIRLLNAQGVVMRQQRAKSGTIEFNVTNLPEGTYYLHIHDGVSRQPRMHQIVVER